jgi:hypothetical protein
MMLKTLAMVFVAATAAYGQTRTEAPSPPEQKPEPAPRVEPDLVFLVVPVKNLDLEETADIIKRLEPRVRCDPSESVSGLVLRGEKKQVSEVVAMIQQLEDMVLGVEEETVVYRIRHRDLSDVIGHLYTTVESCRFAADESTGQIIACGPRDELAQVESLLKRLDLPTSTARVTFDFFRVDGDPNEATDDDELTARGLTGVVFALQQAGMKNVAYLGSTQVRCTDGEEFGASRKWQTPPNHAYLKLQGMVKSLSDEDLIRVSVRAEAQFMAAVSGREEDTQDRHSNEFNVETTLTVRPSEAVILASAPYGVGAGEGSLVLVVRADWQRGAIGD